MTFQRRVLAFISRPATVAMLLAVCCIRAQSPADLLRHEAFDREPFNWEGINHRSTAFPIRTVSQNFGYSPSTSRAGGSPGEIGGQINPAGEAAHYGYRLPDPLSFDTKFEASGQLYLAAGNGHFFLGLYHTNTLNEWRTANTLGMRVNNRGDHVHVHLEYCTSRWRAGAGVIGAIVPGERIDAAPLPAGKSYEWKLAYDPNGAGGRGAATLRIAGFAPATFELTEEHRRDGAHFTHFGFTPILKTWDDPGEVWLDNLTVNGKFFDFSQDPSWDQLNNRRVYQSSDTRPRFDFGWSPTQHAGGKNKGELGGLIFRGDCREPARMAAYGDRLPALSLNQPLVARGKVAVLRAISDSTASLGFYHSQHSMRSNPSQKNSIPMDFLGINIEGPSSEGFYFYPVYRVHGDAAKALGSNGGAPRINPDRQAREWFLKYDPMGANGAGEITVGLDGQTCRLPLEPGHKEAGATFDRFGICTPWIDGNSVTVYFDDLAYTAATPK